MIRVTSTHPAPAWSLDYDDYLAVTVRWATPDSSTPYYFRLRDEERVLIELGVDPGEFSICKLNIVSIGRLGSEEFPDVPVKDGSPVFDPPPGWEEPPARIDVRGPVGVSYWAPYLTVVRAGAENALIAYDAGGARFAVDRDGELVAMTVPLPDGPHEDRLRGIAGVF